MLYLTPHSVPIPSESAVLTPNDLLVLAAVQRTRDAIKTAQAARDFGVTWMVQRMLNQDARDALAATELALLGRWN